LTDEKETIGNVIRITFKQPHDLQDQRGIAFKEIRPSLLAGT
jgi:hypothetical protein